MNIDVPDIARGEAFYTRAFGLRVGRRFEGFLELLGLEAPLYLLEKKEGSEPFKGANAKRSYVRHWSPVHIDIRVPDIRAAVAHARDAGATFETEIADVSYGKIAMGADPFGHGFCLLEFNVLGYDAMPLVDK